MGDRRDGGLSAVGTRRHPGIGGGSAGCPFWPMRRRPHQLANFRVGVIELAANVRGSELLGGHTDRAKVSENQEVPL